MTKSEFEELEVLRYAGVPEIPEAVTDKDPVWIDAIAKVMTVTGRVSYAIVRCIEYGKAPAIRKMLNDEGIARIISIHPYKFLDASFVPKFQNAAETKKFIANVYGVPWEQVLKLKKEELMRLLYTHCIKAQLEYEKNQSTKKDNYE